MENTLNALAREIIEQNQYMTIGTVNSDQTAWVSPVAYAHDKYWNLYFVTMPNTRHGKNLQKNNAVSVAIFDSHQPWGDGVGVWIEGKIQQLSALESAHAASTYFKRSYPYGSITSAFGLGLKKLLQQKTYYFYRLTPEKVWINDPDSSTDERVEVDLSELL